MPELGPWKRFVAAQSMAWFRLLSRQKKAEAGADRVGSSRGGHARAPGGSRASGQVPPLPLAFGHVKKQRFVHVRPTLPSNKSNNGKKETNKAKKKGGPKANSEELSSFSSLSAPRVSDAARRDGHE